ncbi:MAG: Two-component system histidine kinase DccS [uncultured Sulfurovum sp.]|uniref:histidine kinase n=1 Tax=uncultured Sulfurovum sp. TaxID=269237 RepID=A0A6S6TST5_9BACT|nr:MAG: Two-component system histidine kinase DccS [uncultured Sulfurovum sp.]
MVLTILATMASYYYQTQEKLMLSNQRDTLSEYAYKHAKKLKSLHEFFDDRTFYPRDNKFKSAIYDIENKKIFSQLEDTDISFNKEIYILDNHIHFVKTLDEYYLGTRFIIIEVKDDGAWKGVIWKNIMVYGLAFFLLFFIIGLYLAKLFLKPMKDSINLLDRFIKDTTHELNTPLSAILANIEMMDTKVMEEKNIKKLNRINVAAKTVSSLYSDLTYLTLEQEKLNYDEHIDVKEFIEQRVEYFDILAKSKKLIFDLDLNESNILMDKRKFTKVIDNLISNAIKYNKRAGTIGIVLKQNELTVWDTGVGIDQDKITLIFDRYKRFNNSEGGFGIGLNIVKKIIDEYNISIDVESKYNEGTTMVLQW